MLSISNLVCSFLAFVFINSTALAAGYEVEFGPYIGSGESSDNSNVRYVSGFRANLSREIWQSALLKVSPILTLENSFFNTRTEAEDTVTIADYDHRSFGAGLELSSPATWSGKSFDIFLRSSFAKSFTKVGVDQSTPTMFSQRLIHGVRGQQNSIELGASVPLQTDFFVGISVLRSLNRLDQSKSEGTDERETNTNSPEGLTLSSRSVPVGQTGLPDSVTQTALGASITASVLF